VNPGDTEHIFIKGAISAPFFFSTARSHFARLKSILFSDTFLEL